jgi:hypothetical protein
MDNAGVFKVPVVACSMAACLLLPSHGRGRRFDPCIAHHCLPQYINHLWIASPMGRVAAAPARQHVGNSKSDLKAHSPGQRRSPPHPNAWRHSALMARTDRPFAAQLDRHCGQCRLRRLTERLAVDWIERARQAVDEVFRIGHGRGSERLIGTPQTPQPSASVGARRSSMSRCFLSSGKVFTGGRPRGLFGPNRATASNSKIDSQRKYSVDDHQ